MTDPQQPEREIEREDNLHRWASAMRRTWDANEWEIHKRPPFRSHSFDGEDRFWVVGSTGVSVLHGWSGSEVDADRIASVLNADHLNQGSE